MIGRRNGLRARHCSMVIHEGLCGHGNVVAVISAEDLAEKPTALSEYLAAGLTINTNKTSPPIGRPVGCLQCQRGGDVLEFCRPPDKGA